MTEKHPRTAAHYETPINILLLSKWVSEREIVREKWEETIERSIILLNMLV